MQKTLPMIGVAAVCFSLAACGEEKTNEQELPEYRPVVNAAGDETLVLNRLYEDCDLDASVKHIFGRYWRGGFSHSDETMQLRDALNLATDLGRNMVVYDADYNRLAEFSFQSQGHRYVDGEVVGTTRKMLGYGCYGEAAREPEPN